VLGELLLAATIGTVGALVADDFKPGDPVAVTVTLNTCPTSPATGVYVAAVAPAIHVLFPDQLYATEVAPFQVPLVDERTRPT
jgi:hypothetical protein